MRQRYIKNAVTLELKSDACIGCGLCTEVCPHAVFAVENKKAVIADRDACMGCGACAKNCPVEAIKADRGVGCAYALILGALRGSEPTCGCGDKKGSCC